MKKAVGILLALIMILSLAACGGGDGGNSTPNTPETEDSNNINIDEPDETADETPRQTPNENVVSGFDEATNQTLSFRGIDFSFPAYYDLREDSPTLNDIYFYHYSDESDFFAFIDFTYEEISVTQQEFDEAKPDIVNNLISGFESETELLESNEITIAGMSAWTITFTTSLSDIMWIGHSSFVYNKDDESVIFINSLHDVNDTSSYDYYGDYEKILKAAVLSSEASSVAVAASTSNSGGWREFLADYEAWVDNYIAFMEKYYENPTDLSLLTDYMELLEEVTEWEEDLEQIETELNDPAELREYTTEYLRILEKMMSVLY